MFTINEEMLINEYSKELDEVGRNAYVINGDLDGAKKIRVDLPGCWLYVKGSITCEELTVETGVTVEGDVEAERFIDVGCGIRARSIKAGRFVHAGAYVEATDSIEAGCDIIACRVEAGRFIKASEVKAKCGIKVGEGIYVRYGVDSKYGVTVGHISAE